MKSDSEKQPGAPDSSLDPKDKAALAKELEQQSLEESPPDIIIEN